MERKRLLGVPVLKVGSQFLETQEMEREIMSSTSRSAGSSREMIIFASPFNPSPEKPSQDAADPGSRGRIKTRDGTEDQIQKHSLYQARAAAFSMERAKRTRSKECRETEIEFPERLPSACCELRVGAYENCPSGYTGERWDNERCLRRSGINSV